tara:strand:- start:136 stop:546 length:411 start_codon:yes stop_codon:yes gene_type:complete
MSSSPKLTYSWTQYKKDIHYIADNIEFKHVIGIYRGSLPIATHLSNIKDAELSIIGFQTRDGNDKEPKWLLNKIGNKIAPILLIDDIYDTGKTMKDIINFVHRDVHPVCLFGRPNNDDVQFLHLNEGKWVVFPWET